MNRVLIDNQQRALATDPTQSFIVQAPAGSGKTEILTQRYLRLLSTVDTPEQIIALTFTRKAANEMRERIILALQRVANGIPAVSAHQQNTHRFATLALERDHLLGWQLLTQPSRLRVITIDSLCQTLTQAIPLQEKQVHYAKPSDKPQALYLQAAQACLNYLTSDTAFHETLKILLDHLDNRQDHVLNLFCDLLAKRDQWLALVYQARLQDKASFEAALKFIEQHELTRFKQSIPREYALELITLTRTLAVIKSNSQPFPHLLCDWQSLNELDGSRATSLASLLLTTQNSLRKAFDHHVGLKRGSCSDKDYDELKTASKLLLSQLDALPDFLDALIRIKRLPNPVYDAEQWAILQALFTVLPLLVAHLNLVFNEHNQVDFTAISQQALQALGDEQNPTDLALYLDHRIQHLLIDEFQDTSIGQFQLLTQLVQGFESNDGRTVFVVGDPMQSIYRFRSAEVGLFLRTQQQGIGAVKLIPLELSCNFRSTATIINFVNQQFKSIFPASNDIESGAVTFHPSVTPHQHENETDSYVHACQYEDRVQEAEQLILSIRYELATYPNDNIAILVRSRNQLTQIIKRLREEKIPFQGVDIDLLANLPHLRDIWSLTQALLMPANRLAWLACLRSPWCGLSLSDLHHIANFAKSKSIYFALSQLDRIDALSSDGQARARFMFNVLSNALAHRHQQKLVDWIMQTLNALYLDLQLDHTQRDDLEQYWLLLEQFEKDGQIENLTLFKQEFNKLYSKKVTPARLQIMTIHKSKGLEFDCVILPGLGAQSLNRDTPLLRWLKIPTQQHNELLLLSPIKAAHQDHCFLYDYLGKLDEEKSDYELQRLLYVAITRAKKRLYLFDANLNLRQGSFKALLKQVEFSSEPSLNPIINQGPQLPTLYHLPVSYYQQVPNINFTPANTLPKLGNHTTPRLIGIVAHELLQWICNHHPVHLNDVPWALATHQLKTLGFSDNTLKLGTEQIKQQITTLFNDSIGQWIIKKHVDERNEYELLTYHQDDIITKIIDRTFYENGIRWIIDFKTGTDDPENHQNYQQQLNDYAALFTDETIHCGLYYLATNHWVPWVFDTMKLPM